MKRTTVGSSVSCTRKKRKTKFNCLFFWHWCCVKVINCLAWSKQKFKSQRESFQRLRLVGGFAISFSVSPQTEGSQVPSGSLNYLAVTFVGRSEVALNPWPLWHTEEWLGSPVHLKKKKKRWLWIHFEAWWQWVEQIGANYHCNTNHMIWYE